ncbi:MAG: oxygenase MpaB family protein [Verrucomicrobiota bacterium]
MYRDPITTRWTDNFLDSARQDADDYGDTLAADIFSSPAITASGRLGYNKLISLADTLESDPELMIIPGSELATDMASFPEELRNYYAPMPAPDWVDEGKLETAAIFWENNSLAMLGVLYAASLPACYLMKNGIPALYQTEKLRDQKYIFQRIYETGVMLEGVMKPGGLRVVQDVQPDISCFVEAALHKLDPQAKWKLNGQTATPSPGLNAVKTFTKSEMHAAILEARAEAKNQPRRFIWGSGYIQAKKVRLLHSSMRYMLMYPDKVHPRGTAGAPASLSEKLSQRPPTQPWPSEKFGKPVNQEDLAFTLLTFGYLIPKGMESWGCRLSDAEKEAFLHLWRVVGHVMGLRDDLMTDNWQAGGELYNAILKRQGGTSEAGIALTDAVMGFLRSYLPEAFHLREYIPVVLIADLMGESTKDLLAPKDIALLNSAYGRFLQTTLHFSLTLYYRYYQGVLEAFPFSQRLFGNMFSNVSEALIASWRDEFRREPFFIPADATSWQLRRGADEEFSATLQTWRVEVLTAIVMPILWLGLTGVAGIAGLLGMFLHSDLLAWSGLAACILMFFNAFHGIDTRLPKVCAARPKPQGIHLNRSKTVTS